MPAIEACIIGPIWDQVCALLPPHTDAHPLGCHRSRIPDHVVFDKLVRVLVFGCAYGRIADEVCSASTLRRVDGRRRHGPADRPGAGRSRHRSLSHERPVWRRRLSGAFQDFFMFEYPVQQSVGVGDLPNIDSAEHVSAALRRAGADRLVMELPKGLGTQLGVTWESGVGLSHGQWQRIALARAYMRRTPLVLVLDEPASALDAETEHALFDRYAQAAREDQRVHAGGMTILVSHRFSTVQMADLIVVVVGARIVEYGTHAELMASDGTYAELYNLQAASYR